MLCLPSIRVIPFGVCTDKHQIATRLTLFVDVLRNVLRRPPVLDQRIVPLKMLVNEDDVLPHRILSFHVASPVLVCSFIAARRASSDIGAGGELSLPFPPVREVDLEHRHILSTLHL